MRTLHRQIVSVAVSNSSPISTGTASMMIETVIPADLSQIMVGDLRAATRKL